MLHWIWVGFQTSPINYLFIASVVCLMSGGLVFVVADHFWPRKSVRKVVLSLPTGLLVALLATVWLSLSDGRPVWVTVLEREGERRVAVISLMENNKGGRTCFVGTWTLPGRQRVGRTALPGSDCSRGDGLSEIAWLHEYRAPRWFSWGIHNPVAVDLWTGRRRFDVLSSLGTLPGNGEVKIHPPKGDSVRVDLQDGTTRTLQAAPLEPPVTSFVLDTRLQRVEIPGLFQAKMLEGFCGCTPSCGTLVLHSSVAFGEGEQRLGLVREDGLAWSMPLEELVGDELLGTLVLDGECVLVGQDGSARLTWLEPATGRVKQQLSL